jgi:3-hydroxybutyryl-CoA dehydratase
MVAQYFEDLSVGQTASFAKTITEADVLLFSAVSGDTNPVHINAEYAATTPFKERVAHGMLSASLISTVLGTKLPGPGCVYIDQSLRFRAPVRIGSTVTAEVTVKSLDARRKWVTLDTVCTVGGKKVISGEAVMIVEGRPA